MPLRFRRVHTVIVVAGGALVAVACVSGLIAVGRQTDHSVIAALMAHERSAARLTSGVHVMHMDEDTLVTGRTEITIPGGSLRLPTVDGGWEVEALGTGYTVIRSRDVRIFCGQVVTTEADPAADSEECLRDIAVAQFAPLQREQLRKLSWRDLRRYRALAEERAANLYFEFGSSIIYSSYATTLVWNGYADHDETLLLSWSTTSPLARGFRVFAESIETRLELVEMIAESIRFEE